LDEGESCLRTGEFDFKRSQIIGESGDCKRSEKMTDVIVITPATIDPVSLAEVRLWVRERTGITSEDTLLTNLIEMATRKCQQLTNRQFINATLEWTLPDFPSNSEKLVVPFPPLVSVTSIKYVDVNGVTQTWGSGNYQVYTKGEPGMIWVNPGISYPDVKDDILDGVQIRYVAGFGTAITNVPETIRTTILLLVCHYFDNRELATVGFGTASEIPVPAGIERLLEIESMREFV